MKRYSRLIAFCAASVLALPGCAGRHYETDRTSPSYQQSRFLAPQTGYDANDPGLAVMALVASGVSLAANRDYYRKIAITGRCLCRGRNKETLELPCDNLQIAITDPKGHELGRTETRGGEFAFQVSRDRTYLLRNLSTAYEIVSGPTQPLVLGDDVVLHLAPKAIPAARPRR